MSAPGWYGKVASLGDFASRRLDADFIARWDAWLQDVIPRSQDQLGASWLEMYLTCAVWRFIERGDGDVVHAGILMPSVDKVGRYFPLCIAAKLAGQPTSPASTDELGRLLDRFEAVALDSLDRDTSAAVFDDRVLAVEVPTRLVRRPHGRDAQARPRDPAFVAPDDGSVAVAPGCSLWWIGEQGPCNASAFIVRGLPRAEHFLAMLRAEPVEPQRQ